MLVIRLPRAEVSTRIGLAQFLADLRTLNAAVAEQLGKKTKPFEPIVVAAPHDPDPNAVPFLVIHVVRPRDEQVVAQYHFTAKGNCTRYVLQKGTRSGFDADPEITTGNQGARQLVHDVLQFVREHPYSAEDRAFVRSVRPL